MAELQIARAHSYLAVASVRNELGRLPAHWWGAIATVPWFILPDDLSPLFVGLLAEDSLTHDGRWYSGCGGWAGRDDTDPRWRWTPHIYLSHSSAWAAVHEAAHFLEIVWDAPIDDLFQPDLALDGYMRSNPAEYFACGLDAFRWPRGTWPHDELERRQPIIWKYLQARL